MGNIKMHKMCLYNLEWQLLRVSLNFSSEKHTAESIGKLEDYLQQPLKGYDTEANKLWRVLNLLNAVRMGNSGQRKLATAVYRLHDIDSRDRLVEIYRDQVGILYHTSDKRFNWNKEMELGFIQEADPSDLMEVFASLTKRKKVAIEKKLVEVHRTRPELMEYLEMLYIQLLKVQ